jgi:hypothetical protein
LIKKNFDMRLAVKVGHKEMLIVKAGWSRGLRMRKRGLRRIEEGLGIILRNRECRGSGREILGL